jgi:hypothetical protein
MGSLAWLGYLFHTQVVESSNLSPSNIAQEHLQEPMLIQLTININKTIVMVTRRETFVIFIDLSRAPEYSSN